VSPEKLSEEAERILGATAPEDEFMAIATWSGRCLLAHKLAPDWYPPEAAKMYTVPDLFAVFEHNGRVIPTLVEVKSTFSRARPGPLRFARLSSAYRTRLQNHGRMLGLPVLVAQQVRPMGIWVVVDLESVGVDGKLVVNPRHDLSSLLLGAFSLTFRAGTRFVFGVEREHVVSEKEFRGIIREAHFETANGTRIAATRPLMMLLFGLGDPTERQEDDGTTVTMIWEIPTEISFFNYQALRAALSLDKRLIKEPFPWTTVLRAGKFPINHSDIEAAREEGEFFSTVIHTRPERIPDYLMHEP